MQMNRCYSIQFIQMKTKIRQEVLADKGDSYKNPTSDHIEYGLGKGALIPKLYRRTSDNWKNMR